jgi:hypothetical protein
VINMNRLTNNGLNPVAVSSLSQNPIREAATERRVSALFKAMSTDFLLCEQFLTDPAQVLADFVGGKSLPQAEADAYNHMIYSIAASPALLSWLRSYSVKQGAHRPSLDQFLLDFGHAVADRQAHHVVNALVHGATRSHAPLSSEVMNAAKNGLIHVFGNGPDRPGGSLGGEPGETFPVDTFKTQGTWTGTATSGTWTTVDTGTIFTSGGTVTGTLTVTDLETWHTGTETTGTESTGTETTGTDSTGTEMTGTEFTGTESTGTEATGTSATGTESTGTETTGTESTGTETTGTDSTGTETTGTGTETDSGFGFSQYNWAAVTLTALAQYAAQLARAGALGHVAGNVGNIGNIAGHVAGRG